jgi:hypothetical protein
LKQLAREYGTIADGDNIADKHLPEPGRQCGRVVAHLVGVRENNVLRLLIMDELLQRDGKAIGGILG